MTSTEITFKDASVVWDLKTDCPALYAKLATSKHEPWLTTWLAETARAVPTSSSHHPFEGSGWCRPPGHARAMYRSLASVSSTLCIKGTEAYCPDLDSELEQGTKRDMHQKYVNQIEWWLRAEQKAPYVYSVKEGLTEAKIAADVQLDYYDHFGRFAKLPIPLRVYKFPDALRARYLAKLQSVCGPGVTDLAEFVVSTGLGAYCYLFEGTYQRVDVLGHPAAAERGGYPGRRQALQGYLDRFDLDQSMTSWIELAVELLSIGWIPTNYNADSTGQMVRFINATIDGGFVDMDSVRRISDVRSDQDFFKSFWYMICELSSCYAVAMSGNCKFPTGVFASNWYPSPSYGDAMCAVVTWDAFVACAREAKRGGVIFDDRIELLLSVRSPFSKLEAMLSALFPRMTAVQCGGTGSERA